MKKLLFISIILFLVQLNGKAQTENSKVSKVQFVNFQTGFMGDNYNSAGLLFKLEYSKQLKKTGIGGRLP